jgi:signal transduction histidine kinase
MFSGSNLCQDCIMASRRASYRPATAAVAAGALALGIAAEAAAYDWSSVRSWAPDLAVGWGLVAVGLAARRAAPQGPCAWLLCAAGCVWFLGNFAGAGVAVVGWVAAHGAYVHRALLAHAIVESPRGQLGRLLARGVVAFAYVAAFWPALATSDRALVAFGAAVAAAAAFGPPRRAPAAAALVLAFGGVAAARLLLAPVDETTLLRVYEAAILGSAAALAFALATGQRTAGFVDRVVELGETTTLREALRRVLADPSLELGFRRGGAYVDERGRLLAPSTPEGRVTELTVAGGAVLFHDPSLALEQGLANAVAQALGLTTEHARLQAETYERLAELRASRQRLVHARGRQRALTARRLRERIGLRLGGLEAALAGIDSRDPAVAEAIGRAQERVRSARKLVGALAQGLQPPALASAGLPGALRTLAENSPVPVSLTLGELRLDAAVEQAVYLVCAEALANAAKHADATRIEVRLRVAAAALRLEIFDDGRGGADRRGSGLRGVAERVEELGGTLRVDSPTGCGTRLTVELPLHADSAATASGKPEQAATLAGAMA